MPQIPTYQSKIQPRQKIGVPFQSGATAARAEQQLAGTIAQAGNLLQRQAEKRQNRLNTVMVSDAYAQLQKKSFNRLNSITQMKGKEALNVFEDYKKWFNKESQTISKNLQNDRQREIFSLETTRLQEARFNAVSRHQAREEKVYQSSVYNTNVALAFQEAVTQPFDDKVISNVNTRLMGLTAALHPGENVASINMANDQKLQTLRIKAMIDKNPERAAGYIEKLKSRLGDRYFELKRLNEMAIDRVVGNSLYDKFKTANYAISLEQEETVANNVKQENFDPFAPVIDVESVPDFDTARSEVENNKKISSEKKRQILGWINQDENKYIRLKNENERAIFDSARNNIAEMLLGDNTQEAYQVVENSSLPEWTKLNLKEFIKSREENIPSTTNMVEVLKNIDADQIQNESDIKALKAANILTPEQASTVTQYLKEKKTNDKFYIDRALDLFNKTFTKEDEEILYKPDFEIWLREKITEGTHGLELYEEAKRYLAATGEDWTLLNPSTWFSGDSKFQKDIESGEFNAQPENIPPEIKKQILQDIADTPGLSPTPEVIDYVYQRKYKNMKVGNDKSD